MLLPVTTTGVSCPALCSGPPLCCQDQQDSEHLEQIPPTDFQAEVRAFSSGQVLFPPVCITVSVASLHSQYKQEPSASPPVLRYAKELFPDPCLLCYSSQEDAPLPSLSDTSDMSHLPGQRCGWRQESSAHPVQGSPAPPQLPHCQPCPAPGSGPPH